MEPCPCPPTLLRGPPPLSDVPGGSTGPGQPLSNPAQEKPTVLWGTEGPDGDIPEQESQREPRDAEPEGPCFTERTKPEKPQASGAHTRGRPPSCAPAPPAHTPQCLWDSNLSLATFAELPKWIENPWLPTRSRPCVHPGVLPVAKAFPQLGKSHLYGRSPV